MVEEVQDEEEWVEEEVQEEKEEEGVGEEVQEEKEEVEEKTLWPERAAAAVAASAQLH